MKQIKAKIGEYQKDGETKGRFIDVGVILSNDKGEYAILNPAISLSGVLMKQRMLAQKNQTKAGDGVMCSIWDNSNQNNNQNANQSNNQQTQQQSQPEQAKQQNSQAVNPDDYF